MEVEGTWARERERKTDGEGEPLGASRTKFLVYKTYLKANNNLALLWPNSNEK